MDRLQSELQRLYLLPDAPPHEMGPAPVRLSDAQDRTRTLVLELGGPEGWQALGSIWERVQSELGLPAPGIAISGTAGLQLWFSLAAPVPAAQAHGFLAALQRRHLADTPPHRLAMTPSGAAGPHTAALPPFEAGPGRWSAFITPDLAPLFADEPWLDLPPGVEAQAELLGRLQTTALADWQQALQSLKVDEQGERAPEPPHQVQAGGTPPPAPPQRDPRQFLLDVMNDASVDLRLRIEAAKALLPHAGR